jgi:protein tyrosine/serine phosphatase
MTRMPATDEAPSATRVRRRLPWRRLAFLLLAALLLPVAAEAYHILFGDNFHTVIAGQVYRCSQPSGETLERLITTYQIRTVVNLRGYCESLPWYVEECRATHNHNVSQEDINFSAGRYPSSSELRHLLEVLDRTEYPILLHCRRGADRTGLAAMIVLLLKSDASLVEARRQLGWRRGHVAVGRTACLDLVAEYYADWLQSTGKQHTPDNFRDWAQHHYCPGSCRGVLSWAATPSAEVQRGQPAVLRVRVHHTGAQAWQLSPLLTAGVHLGCHVYDEEDHHIDLVKTGLREGQVLPGQTVEFTLVVQTSLLKPGRYLLLVDMVDEQQCWFYQTGSEPLEQELIVRE